MIFILIIVLIALAVLLLFAVAGWRASNNLLYDLMEADPRDVPHMLFILRQNMPRKE